MGSCQRTRRKYKYVSMRYIPLARDSNGVEDYNASVEDRVKLAEKAGVPYIYMEMEKPNGSKVTFIIHAEQFKKMSKTDINKLFKGLS